MLMMVCSSFYLVCQEERKRKHTTRRAFMFRNVIPTYLCCRYIYLLFDCEKCTQPERTVFVSRMWLNNKINNIIVILHLYLTCIVGRSCILLLVFLGRPSSAHMRLCVFVFMATGYVWDEDIGYIIMCVQQWLAFTTFRVVLWKYKKSLLFPSELLFRKNWVRLLNYATKLKVIELWISNVKLIFPRERSLINMVTKVIL